MITHVVVLCAVVLELIPIASLERTKLGLTAAVLIEPKNAMKPT